MSNLPMILFSFLLSPAFSQSTADFDGNGRVDFADFLSFAGAYGSSETLYDLDGDGKVEFPDFLVFVQAYQTENASTDAEPEIVPDEPPAGDPGEPSTITTSARTEHDLVLVPAGEFTMGSEIGDPKERPIHTVFVSNFRIDRFEVTNLHFAAFLNAVGENKDKDGHKLIGLEERYTPEFAFREVQIVQSATNFSLRDPDTANHPVYKVTWYGANAYCEWIGGRLPTEAEWEKAATGTDGREYPWGNELESNRANFGGSGDPFDNGTTPVGYFDGSLRGDYQTQDGSSPYGVHDMAGNVWEWVYDHYDSRYYGSSPLVNPKGPESGNSHSVRGGNWGAIGDDIRTATRDSFQPEGTSFNLGFRCVLPIK